MSCARFFQLLCVIVTLSFTTEVFAQSREKPSTKESPARQEGKFGIDYSYSGSLNHWGVWWHVAQKVALSPRLGFALGDGKSDFQIGILVPIYLANLEKLDLFIAPFLGFGSLSQEVKVPNPGGGGMLTSTVKSSGFEISVNLGTQYPIAEQVHIFGMAGLALNFQSIKNGRDKSSTTLTTTRSALGVIFYFN